MQPIIRSLVRNPATVKANCVAVRNYLVVGPPRVRVSFVEKLLLGGVMLTSICAPSLWVMAHLQDYKKRS